jgi:hypothetical protein
MFGDHRNESVFSEFCTFYGPDLNDSDWWVVSRFSSVFLHEVGEANSYEVAFGILRVW